MYSQSKFEQCSRNLAPTSNQAFKSKISNPYTIIIRIDGDNSTLKAVCEVPGITPTLQTTATEPPDHFTSQPTSVQSSVKDYTTGSDQSTVYIAAGVSAGGLFIVIAVLVIIFCKRKSSDKKREPQEARKQATNFQNEQDDPYYGGLKYNMLYVSAEHQDAFEGDYHTVHNDQPPFNKKVSEHDINYSTVDDNIARTSLNTIPTRGVVKNSN
ncbi:unnamed protein product [Mytilus coruscus]|uniref:Uncharacterized protein n=1 Tax=Mytilus coruscus TaxID=42192 RepID=A0A6J8EEF9_MYTCO|nr:unnamed protein product [Mytilus coruscus]